MSATWGNNFKITIFGESHGEAIGVVIDGLKSGKELDLDFIQFEMNRRKPGTSTLATPRKEDDKIEILSGLFNGKTTGAPLTGIIRNTNTRSGDYNNDLLRPSHADFSGYVKYDGFNDYRGGGPFSGRITSGLVFAGAVAKEYLKDMGITIGSHVLSVKNESDMYFDPVNLDVDLLNNLNKETFPVISKDKKEKFINIIEDARKNRNSVGGVVEVACVGLSAGIGEPFFNSIESNLSSLFFSVPAVKGVEFGLGFDITKHTGSEVKDEPYVDSKANSSLSDIKFKSNNNGGINGGISNGMPIVARVAIKPTPSIGQSQNTVNIKTLENTNLEITGRHDPAIVSRVSSVIEATMAIGIFDLIK